MIYTFYSYKGGVGRSMAMAAVAYVFAQRGLRVLAIDFDLEAPGLERYFFEPEHAQQVRAQPGLIELLQTYKLALTNEAEFREARFHNLWNFIQEAIPAAPGRVDLMTAGQREPAAKLAEYASAVRGFDWLDFFDNWKGKQFFEWLRTQLLTGAEGTAQPYDVVLVDTRTGVTEMGGVCAYQLADCAVMLCAANYQNIEGTLAVARDFLSEAVRALRKGRSLELLVLPARLEENNDNREKFLSEFEATFERSLYLPHVLYDVGLDYRALAQPYDRELAVIERLVGEAEAANASSSHKAVRSFTRLADALTLLAANDGKLRQQQPSVLARLRNDELAPEAVQQIADPTQRTAGFDVFIDYSRPDEPIARALGERLEQAGFKVWRDTENLRSGAAWSEQLNQVLALSEVLIVIIGTAAPSSHLGRTIALAQQRGRPRIVPVQVRAAGGERGPRTEVLAGLGLLAAQLVTIDTDVRDEPAVEQIVQIVRARPRPATNVLAQSVASARSPYPGERALSEDDSAFFFGRESELEQLAALATRAKLTLLTGAAGVGKTSLLCAGLIPRLRRTATTRDVQYIDCTEEHFQKKLHELHRSRARWPAWIVMDGVDTFHSNGRPVAMWKRIAVIEQALSCAPRRTKFVLALRDVFDADMSSAAIERWCRAREVPRPEVLALAPMDADALHAAIERPAARLGHLIEPGLTKLLIDNAGSPHSAIAQVARALPRLWDERRRGWITMRTYEAMGGVQGAFERAVEALGDNLSDPQQRAFETLVGMLSVFDTAMQSNAAPGRWSLLATIPNLSEADAIALRDRLASLHLIDLWRTPTTGDSRPAQPDKASEGQVAVALLYGTPRHYGKTFNKRLDRAFLLWRRSFSSYVRSWELSRRSDGAVVLGAPLVEAQTFAAIHKDELTEPERMLLRASVAVQRKQESERTSLNQREAFRLKLAVGAAGVLLAMVAGIAVWALQADSRAQRNAARAELAVQDLRKAYAEQEQKRERTERVVIAIAGELETLRKIAARAPASRIKRNIVQVESSIGQHIQSLNDTVVRVPVRIHIQIVDESQRASARQLERRIEAQRLGEASIVVPRIELVDAELPFSVLRCFAPAECKQLGARIQAIVNAELREPQVQLLYAKPVDRLRADHFELRFASGSISLAPSRTSAAAD